MGAFLTRPAWRSAAALGLLVGACGGHAPSPRTDTSGVNETTPTTAAASGQSPARSTRDATPRPTTATRRGDTPTNARSNNGSSTSGRDTIVDASRQRPGQFAGVLLAPGVARTIVLDVRVESGASVDQNAVASVAQILRQQSHKPVAVHGPTALADSAQTHDADSIRRLADTQGDSDGDDAAVVHLFFFAGHFADDGVLGVTVRADTTAVFPDDIASASSPLVSESRVARAVVTHEMGHVLGLVDLYLDDHRDDPDHPGHSTNRGSVMFWAVESDVVSQVLGGPPPVDFDQADLADLRRIAGGAAAQVS